MGNLNKVVYTDHQTVITADNLNAIQDSVIQNTSYTTCSTAANTAAKTAALTNFVLTTGSAVKIKFTNTNTAANPTLNINSTGAKPIMMYGSTVSGQNENSSWSAGAVVEFVYDGTNWVVQGKNVSENGIFRKPVYIDQNNGTTTTVGTSTLWVGNGVAEGTDGNSKGQVVIYGNDEKYVNIQATNATGNRTVELPDENGTLMSDKGGTFIGNVSVDRANGTTSSNGTSSIFLGNATPSGTAGNSYGRLQLYGTGANYGVLLAQNVTANREVQIPNASGTIALTSNTIQHVSYGSSNDLNNVDHGVIGWCNGVQNKPTSSGTYGYIFAPETTAKSIQTYYEYSSSPDKIAKVYHRAYVNNAWTPWYKLIANPETNDGVTPLTVTRVENAFANAESISRIIACKKSGILSCSCNLAITTGGTTNDVVRIAYIDGWNAYASMYMCVPGQNSPSQTLLIYINAVGSIYIYSSQQITPQFFRTSFVTPSVD